VRNADERAPARPTALAEGTAGALWSEALVEEAASPACVLDGHGRIIVANRALETLLGVGWPAG
jgi:PAS domain-containing protein